jgi:hypothetical protein
MNCRFFFVVLPPIEDVATISDAFITPRTPKARAFAVLFNDPTRFLLEHFSLLCILDNFLNRLLTEFNLIIVEGTSVRIYKI